MINLTSIIVPCYNQGEYLADALHGLGQLKADGRIEVIIVNDGSTDLPTLEALDKLEKEGWRVFHQENKGLAQARNAGILLSKGSYLLPLDCDNILNPLFIMEAVRILEEDSCIDIVYSDCLYFGEKEFVNKVGEFNPCRLINDNYIDACALFRKDVWVNLGGYDSRMPAMGHEDWDFWTGAIMQKRKFHYLPMIGYKYRFRTNSMIRTIDGSAIEENRYYIYSKYNSDLLNSIRKMYNPDTDMFKNLYIDLRNYLKQHRIKSIIKILIGRLS